ncbi:hypothetical protein [Flavobacterium urocaniciphilum]|uniref:Uncharacterized protein n=1 Tax=Flavobacterium urocaniciphilum TaxID=1299341 RepID=A0A1H8YT03_9FLAO|nr:hypothetical protein [Flavobacterium urocaniciphilum]SEP55233.1 hypothetical protein SAMN05444005_101158 [Flavobacterium urocaniciphilum]
MNKIKEIRKQLNLSQIDLAIILKTTNQALLMQYQIKKEVLEAEEKILIERLKKLG